MKQFFKHEDNERHSTGEVGEDKTCTDGLLVRGLSNLYSPESKANTHVRDIADILAEMGNNLWRPLGLS